MANNEFSPSRAPKAPPGWNRVANQPHLNNQGWYALYKCQANGLSADLNLRSKPDTDTVEIVLDDYTDRLDVETRTRRYELTVPEIEDIDALNQIASEWVEKAENNEL